MSNSSDAFVAEFLASGGEVTVGDTKKMPKTLSYNHGATVRGGNTRVSAFEDHSPSGNTTSGVYNSGKEK
tara:strand:+ start:3533 stop:3742 length:210 start_codon:yes stop_codon:yes gene_type:complete